MGMRHHRIGIAEKVSDDLYEEIRTTRADHANTRTLASSTPRARATAALSMVASRVALPDEGNEAVAHLLPVLLVAAQVCSQEFLFIEQPGRNGQHHQQGNED